MSRHPRATGEGVAAARIPPERSRQDRAGNGFHDGREAICLSGRRGRGHPFSAGAPRTDAGERRDLRDGEFTPGAGEDMDRDRADRRDRPHGAGTALTAATVPEITDRLIAASIATPRMVEAGRDYWRRGRVARIEVLRGGDGVLAEVGGSMRAPYRVELDFDGAVVDAFCTCPVGTGCKHAAAVLFALRDDGHVLPDATRSAPVASLPLALAQWAATMRPLAERAAAPAVMSCGIVYVVGVQALAGTARMSKKRKPAMLAPPGCALRLAIDPMEIDLDPEGRAIGNGRKLRLPGYAGWSAASWPGVIGDEDAPLVRRLLMPMGDTDADRCLTGAGGADLLARVLATGRARWGTIRGPVLRAAATIPVTPGWMHDDGGRARLYVPDRDVDRVVALVAPPVEIDPVGGMVAPLDLGVTAAMAEHLLRLPPIEPAAVAGLAARWNELVGGRVPPPAAPAIRELGIVAPIPVVTMLIDRVAIQSEPDYYRYRPVAKVDAAVARLAFDYAGAIVQADTADGTILTRDGDGLFRFQRDRVAEAAALARLREAGLLPLGAFDDVIPAARQAWDHAADAPASPDMFAMFLLQDAADLRGEGWRVEVPTAFPLRLVAPDPASFTVDAIPSGIDWFDIALGATIDGERIDLAPAMRRLLARVGADGIEELAAHFGPDETIPVALGDGRVATLPAARLLPMLRALLLLAADAPGGEGAGRARVSRLDLGLIGEIDALLPDLPWTGAAALRDLARALARLHRDPTPLPPGFTATLRPYQQAGLDWLEALARAGFGGLLADDMGLGKTVQTLAHIAAQKEAGAAGRPVLIVAPTSVLPNWQAEAARFVPHLSLLLLHGAARHGEHDRIAGHDIVLTSYPLLIRDRARLADERFALAVFDEAQVLRNPRTAGFAAARALPADRRLALSGTPVENRLTDAWALFDLVVPGLLGNQRSFQRDYRTPIEKHGDGQAKARLSRRLRPFLLRRTKEAVATDLPARTMMAVPVTPGPQQMALHESQRLLMQQRVRDEIARVGLMRAQIVLLSALTRLRQVCCDPRLLPRTGGEGGGVPAPSAKLERLTELLDGMVAEGRRIILFSQFTSMLDLIKPELDRRGHGWVEITGRTKDRHGPVAQFQGGTVPVILISLKAGGTGLNLTAADTVILYDPWWNPAVEAQAIDRAHRIGQDKPVFVYRLIATGTIEEKILALQSRKAALADALWSDDPAAPASLTEDDIAFLLG